MFQKRKELTEDQIRLTMWKTLLRIFQLVERLERRGDSQLLIKQKNHKAILNLRWRKQFNKKGNAIIEYKPVWQ